MKTSVCTVGLHRAGDDGLLGRTFTRANTPHRLTTLPAEAAADSGGATSSGGIPDTVPSDSPMMLPARLWLSLASIAEGDSKVVTAGVE